MNRLLLFAGALVTASAVATVIAACSDSEAGSGPVSLQDAGKDAPFVTLDDAGSGADSSPTSAAPTCNRYCDLVFENCTGVHKQYASNDDCQAFCRHLEEGKAGETGEHTLACRQYFAGNPARTSPAESCKAAGPFGGDKCGDRCTTFCDVTLSACGDAGPVYATGPACQNACAMYTYVEDGADGGGEGPNGPAAGDTLNCRLYWLRKAVADAGACPLLGAQSTSCD